MSIQGRVTITGAGVGLGQALAVAFAETGHDVVGLLFDESQRADFEKATTGLSGTVDAQVVDVTNPGDFTFPDDTDVLVNNAGIRLENLPIESISTDVFRQHMEVNFFGAVEMTRRVIPVMRSRAHGTIVNINSASVTVPIPFLAPYRATKGALAAFSESLRVELAPFGIRILEFLPGAMQTGLTASSIAAGRAKAGDDGYEPLVDALAGAMDGSVIVPALDAARLMVADVQSGHGFRSSTDDGATAMLNAWRDGGGQQLVDGFINRLGFQPGGSIR